MSNRLILFLIVLATIYQPTNGLGQNTLSVEDYQQWQSLGSPQISEEGGWIGYQVSLTSGDDTLHIQSFDGDKAYQFPMGANLTFSEDDKWAAFRIDFTERETEKMREEKKPIQYTVKLIDLETGAIETFADIRRFSFSDDSQYLVLEGYPDKGEKTQNIMLRDLVNGSTRVIGNVAEWAFNEAGDFLAYIIRADHKYGHSVELLDLNENRTRILASDTTAFKQLRWEAEEGYALAFLQVFTDTSFAEDNHLVHAFRSLDESPEQLTFNPAERDDFPEGMRIKETFAPIWSKDEQRIFLGIAEWSPADTTKKKKDEKVPEMEIWHWEDDPIMPRQRVTYNRDKDFSFLSVWNVEDDQFLQLADENAREASIAPSHTHVLLEDMTPYQPQYRLAHADYYVVDARTGERTKALTEFPANYMSGFSGDGQYLAYFQDEHWHTYQLESGEHVNLTEGQDVPFYDNRYDGPREKIPPHGQGGWMEEDEAILLYDEYDVWSFAPDGSGGERITSGRDEEIIHRVLRFDYEDPYLDPEEGLAFSLFGDKTKYSGFVLVDEEWAPIARLYKDKRVRSVRRADDAERYTFVEESYTDSPDVMVASEELDNIRQLSNTNPQQDDYAWGKTELIDYTNADGKTLQGALHYPANYEEGKQYPMIVYIYEIRSNSLNRYIAPTNRRAYNITHWVQQGYFVFQPDIVYKTNHPGESAVECVVPAVEQMIETGMIDRERIGLMGHSWGGYQTAFLVTQTDLFSAAVAGAPLTNMISMYNSIYWNTGTPDQQIFETSQGRLREPWWEITDEYIANSPIFQAENITTPLLVTFGDKDGAVDWHQGIEMYITMRRLHKPMILMVYAGENHGLRKKENQIDYFQKVTDFFQHHLKGEEPAKWIREGRTYLEKKEMEKKAER